MDIDLSILRMLEREKEISFEVLAEAIEQALLTAYQRATESSHPARVELDRKTGHVTVWARELDEDGTAGPSTTTRRRGSAGSPRRPPSRSCCSGCATPRTRSSSASSPARRATSSPDHPAGAQPRRRDGRPRQDRGGPAGERARAGGEVRPRRAHQVPGHVGPQGHARPPDHPVAVPPHPGKKLFALEVPEIADGTVEVAAIAREAGHRTKIAVHSTVAGVNAKGACIGPMGQRVRNVMSELHGEKIDIVDWAEDPAELVAHALSPARVNAVEIVDLAARSWPGGRARLPALPGHRQGGAERPPRRPLTGWRIDIRSDEAPTPE